MAASGGSKVNENIPVDEFKDINTKQFHIESFKNEWLARLEPANLSYKKNDEDTFDKEFIKDCGIAPETLDELKIICSLDSLRCHHEDETPDTELVPPDSILHTHTQRKKKEDYKKTLRIDRPNRAHGYSEQVESITLGRRPQDPEDLVPEQEIILSIQVYHTAVFERFSPVRPHTTLQVFGSHYLSDLRDAIGCVSDLHVFGEFSNTPDLAPGYVSKDHHKSAFFYFEKVFYNDMRFPECQDISMTTIEWAKTRDFPPFSQAKMEDTRFSDLKVRVGYPYYYCHQGDCEHLVIITDIRFVHMEDSLDRTMYPLQTHKHTVQTNRCAVCILFIARWLTTNDQFAPSDPCLFCDKCFKMLHYDKKGNKLGEFNAYVYVDPAVFN